MSKIAVMIAAYNAARYVEDAIASVLRQRQAAAFDILVVDDGSSDGTADRVRAIGVPEIRLRVQENCGVTKTRNVLLSMIAPDTDFVTVLDADDLSPDSRFAQTLQDFARDPALDLVFSETIMFKTTGPDDPLEPDLSVPTFRVRGVQMGAGLYRLDLIRKTGVYDERFRQAEDLDFVIRMLEQQPRFLITEDVAYYYRRHQHNMTKDTRTLQRDVARAMLMAAKRKSKGGPAFPRGFFDLKDYGEHPEWS